jgi:predicted dehydrogenase
MIGAGQNPERSHVMTATRERGALRFGLVGTGYWAGRRHAPAIVAAPGAELVAVWGRNAAAADALAREHGAIAYTDFEQFLDRVDVLSFSVPPDVQAPLAAVAARAGKHLLLEKPIALDLDAGTELLSCVRDADVAALVFFTHLFARPIRTWFAEAESSGPWAGAHAAWLGTALSEANPYNTPWRRQHGGLWDVGPHAVAGLWRTLGPVTHLSVDAGERDLTYLVLHHEGGATSSVTLTLSAPDAADGYSLQLWGSAGRSDMPVDQVDSLQALTVAVTELVDLVATGARAHPCDLTFGFEVLQVLVRAQHLLDDRRSDAV